MTKTSNPGTGEGVKDATPTKKTEFVCKDIVTKKKNPQQMMERYFMVVKQKREIPKRNFQGFPLSQCVYEEEVMDMVYRPTGYPRRTERKKDSSTECTKLCHECLLRPCVVRGKWNEIMGFCEDTMVFENDDSESMYFKMMNHAESIMVEVFGARYCRNNPTPACIQGVVGNYFETKAQMEEEEEDPDEDLVAESIDGADFLTQSYQHP